MEGGFVSFNRLRGEKSRYLVQHRDNPVHWWPYDHRPLGRAIDEDKPIFLSVGYSSCHWCHVMAHESFEDKKTAEFLNAHFINIKIDREEHPDIDDYYQLACQCLGRPGGWPLSAFLTPHMLPFFVGTYFPKASKHPTQPTFLSVLQDIHGSFHQDRKKVETGAMGVVREIEHIGAPHKRRSLRRLRPDSVMDGTTKFADQEYGGYGSQPKFAHFPFFEWALDRALEGTLSGEHTKHVRLSIEKMLMGGIYDHLRGGIHRYSTDRYWLVPHFEKMLYDQAGLLGVLCRMSHACPSPLVSDAITDTLKYLADEMLCAEGYFFASQDADSEGAEGDFFTYTQEQFDQALLDGESPTYRTEEIRDWFQITKKGNFERSRNVISLDFALKDKLFTDRGWSLIRLAKKNLLKERSKRPPPATDTKGIAGWNFLILGALADTARYCGGHPTGDLARQLLERSEPGIRKIFHPGAKGIGHSTTKPGKEALLEDCALYCDSRLKLYELTGRESFKEELRQGIDIVLGHFSDGPVLLTRAKGDGETKIPNQPSPFYDTAFKSPAATFAGILQRARILFGEPKLGSFLGGAAGCASEALLNPLGSGAALAAATYPDSSYRRVTIPRQWAENPPFAPLPPRFVLDYSDAQSHWRICSATGCEHQGKQPQELAGLLRRIAHG